MIVNEVIKIENTNKTFYDITKDVKKIVLESGIKNGSVLIFSKHTTTAIRINENEERLVRDIDLYLERTAPENAKYLHDDINLRDCLPNERLNGHSHVKALFLNSSEEVPVVNGELALGKWQSILFLELDKKRNREIIVQVRGE